MANSRLIDKIKALLALSASPNEHEATAAAAKAQELMATHSLSMSEVDVSESEDETTVHEQFEFAKSSVRWKLMLATGIAKANNVDCFAGYDLKDRSNRKKCIHFVGRSGLVAGCMALYTYLAETVERECKREMALAKDDYCNRDVSWRSWGDSFRKGMSRRISQRLAERKQEMEATDSLHEPIGSALVRQKMSLTLARENEAFVRSLGVRTVSCSSTIGSRSGMAAGRAAGDRAALGGQLNGASPARRRVITGR